MIVQEFIDGVWVESVIPDIGESVGNFVSDSIPSVAPSPKAEMPIPDLNQGGGGLAEWWDNGDWIGFIVGLVLFIGAVSIFWAGISCWWGGHDQISMFYAICAIVTDVWELDGIIAYIAAVILIFVTYWCTFGTGIAFIKARYETFKANRDNWLAIGVICLVIAFVSNGCVMNAGMNWWLNYEETFCEDWFDVLLLVGLYIPGTFVVPGGIGAVISVICHLIKD